MNSKEAYECFQKQKITPNYKKCENCQYNKIQCINNIPYDYQCDIQLIIDHMHADLAGCYNTIESLKILNADYEKEIEELYNEIRRLKLLMPVECCISNTLETENNISLNDLLKLPNVESVNIWFNKKGDKNER
jgi:hypothetical protein